ncbi:MAG: HupE/UreJ family protein [Betaproteobacteria bacterium]
MNALRSFVLVASIATGIVATPALAHKASDSYLTIETSESRLSGRWDIALRDADLALDLDADGDGAITWGELRRRERDLAAWALSRLAVRSGGEPCTLGVQRLATDTHSDGAYAVLELDGACPAASTTLNVDYRLLFELDPQHRGLVRVVSPSSETSAVFSTDARTATIATTGSMLAQFMTYLREGVLHIWGGFDHVLFLVSLLLPAVLVRRRIAAREAWAPVDTFGAAFVDVAKIVTAFTLAHSITLTLAALDLVVLPSRFVESAIALSVVLAALNNLFPVVRHGRWVAAFAFGLVHGFGFAGALADLGLPTGSLALSLAAFNLGVEAGQLAIVAVFLPAAFALRSTLAYRRYALGAGSIAIVAIASVWFAERAFDIALS